MHSCSTSSSRRLNRNADQKMSRKMKYSNVKYQNDTAAEDDAGRKRKDSPILSSTAVSKRRMNTRSFTMKAMVVSEPPESDAKGIAHEALSSVSPTGSEARRDIVPNALSSSNIITPTSRKQSVFPQTPISYTIKPHTQHGPLKLIPKLKPTVEFLDTSLTFSAKLPAAITNSTTTSYNLPSSLPCSSSIVSDSPFHTIRGTLDVTKQSRAQAMVTVRYGGNDRGASPNAPDSDSDSKDPTFWEALAKECKVIEKSLKKNDISGKGESEGGMDTIENKSEIDANDHRDDSVTAYDRTVTVIPDGIDSGDETNDPVLPSPFSALSPPVLDNPPALCLSSDILCEGVGAGAIAVDMGVTGMEEDVENLELLLVRETHLRHFNLSFFFS